MTEKIHVMIDEQEINAIFMEMEKVTKESRHIDCSCCGYHTCKDMACAIYNGVNKKENCIEVTQIPYTTKVEDIIDTGNTLSSLMKLLLSREPASLKLCTLLDKPEIVNPFHRL